ncbi:family 2B encapsulin nanocompartment shell protein [Kibdelosporangium persicum]|uniref:cAMP-binding protein n=1 Tax=Kibdelosporangium persicum TaxID=2698649 RepID=A0ABX2F320_9PSEU|nr:family 2B encapsulin nanocompartment shell protein [Kibdelosporangium persicum]NRN65710.1 cAMP-binding protein [Kibdelosporangium persicum]
MTQVENPQPQLSLSTSAARNLATTTKSVPQMQGITPRWLLRVLPWVQADAGTYRVNRRLTYALGDGLVSFISTAGRVQVVPPELRELALLRGLADDDTLAALADRFEQQEFEAGDLIIQRGQSADRLVLMAHGKASKIGRGEYGEDKIVDTLGEGEYFGDQALTGQPHEWDFSVKAKTRCITMSLSRQDFDRLCEQSETLLAHVANYVAMRGKPSNAKGEAEIELASGHEGEYQLPGTFVDYELTPREYEMSVSQTVLRIHTRVADLYNHPMDQVEQQLRLTIEALRERQEHEMMNNRQIGLLYNADLKQRIHTRSGPPTPDDMDELISRRRKTQFILAHPKAIAAFGRECNRRGIYPNTTELHGRTVRTWRNIPLLPCDKIPVSETGRTSVIAMRTGEKNQGVIALHRTGLPDEQQPGLNVRFMGVDDRAIMSYVVSTYYSVAVLVPDALGILEGVELGREP